MEPVSLVLAALAAGASAGLTSTVQTAAGDAYQGLKSLVRRAFAGDAKAEAALTVFEDDPTEKVLVGKLVDHLAKHNVARDPDLLAAAQRVLDLAGPNAQVPGSVVATILQIHADRGGVAVAQSTGTINAGYTQGTQEDQADPS